MSSTLFVFIASILAVVIGVPIIVSRFYRKVDQGRALIINRLGKHPVVTTTGGLVLPVIHRAETMDISVKRIEIERRGVEGLICRDNIRADIKVVFFVRVNDQPEDIRTVAKSIGCERASDPNTLEELFAAKFSEALKTVGKQLDFEQLYTKRNEFRTQVGGQIGQDLNGYSLEDCAIDFLEQTPLGHLDPKNVLDAQGIRKITEITAEQNIQTNQLAQAERKQIKKQDVEANEAILELDRQEADAKAKQEREIATVRAREEAEVLKIKSEELERSEMARLKQEEQVGVQEENKRREIEVAEKNRERAVAIENERVQKDRDLEAISRERETELLRIDKEKALETERKSIADIVASRVAVERNVALEEENIKNLRVLEEAKRTKDAAVIAAEGDAQEHLVKEIKAAEAAEQVAKHTAKQRLVIAEADLEASDKEARAKIRLAEGTQAEEAAQGLAEVRVKEADAVAEEKQGTVAARMRLEMMQAEAKGSEEQGMAKARVKQAEAGAVAEYGEAEARAVQAKMQAEATGLAEKATAMKALDGAGREHEEYRLRLDKLAEIEMHHVDSRKEIARYQSEVMAKSMGDANINIVGGEGQFFDQFVKAISLGQSLDAGVEQSKVAQKLLGEYLEGDASLRGDLVEILSKSGMSSETLKNLSIVGALRKLSGGVGSEDRGRVDALIAKAEELGLQ